MATNESVSPHQDSPSLSPRTRLWISLGTALVYFLSNPSPNSHYDYTFRVAANMLRGRIAFNLPQPSWLNEFVPFGGYYYSVFPLGAVLSMIPFALLQFLGLINEMPGAWIAAVLAGACCWFCLKIAGQYDVDRTKQIVYSLAILFGTFVWMNLTFAGAWQLALGFAMLGELGAIYFTVYDRRPLLAGVFFAMAFGNRTECLLTAPLLLYLLARRDAETQSRETKGHNGSLAKKGSVLDTLRLRVSAGTIFRFCLIPFVLGIATLAYNYVRFHSIADFGYARIPGVLDEPWYNHGIFSVFYIPRQAYEMLLRPWTLATAFPYFMPDGFSSSILLSSPFLLLTLRGGSKDKALKLAAWIAVALLTILLWMHGNAGGWQFGYRYAMVLLPWVLVLLLESAKKHLTKLEWALFALSFLANAYATWLFNWTDYVKP